MRLRIRQRMRGTLLAGLFLGLFATGHTATLIVDSNGTTPYTTIQSAIDAAQQGDEVFVRCGEYVENVTMRSGIDLRGEGASCTIIDGNEVDSTVTIPAIREPTTVQGFTIRRGGTTVGVGAGIASFGGQPVITGNIIEDNGAGGGFGIVFTGFTDQPDAPIITGNIIRGNTGCCAGGGISITYPEGAVINSNLIVGNSAYYGGGLYIYGGTSEVVNNTVAYNEAWLGGGMALLTYGGSTTLANNAIIGNAAYVYAGGVWYGPDVDSIISNDFFGNTPDDGVGNLAGINGNIAEDPEFVNTDDRSFAGFQPRSTSPLVDAGAVALADSLDIRGIPRPLDGDADGIDLPDIGARENEGITGVRFEGTSLTWDGTGNVPELFNVYRGDIETLRTTGVYTQDPATVIGASQFCVVMLGLDDADDPEVGRGFAYLIDVAGIVEGTLGFDSSLVERPKTLSCTP